MAMKIYKRSQATNTRLYSALGLAVIVGFGCYQLYRQLAAAEFGLNPRAAMWVSTMVPAGLFVVLSLLIVWLSNRHSVADFMISAEGEIKKVSWSSRKEVAVSTVVVIITVVILATLLGLADFVFQLVFSSIL
jgi:preprotein translocase SecE subunit